MLEAAQQAGAEVLLGQDMERLLVRDEPLASVGGGGEGRKQTRVTGVVTADGAVHPADVVVLAAGTSVQRLAAQAGVHVPLLHKPAVVAVTPPLQRPGRLVHHMLANAKVFVWQRPDGSFMLEDSPCLNGANPTAADAVVHAAAAAPPGTHEDGSEAWGQSLLQRAAELVPELRSCGAHVSRVEVAYRPWPQDGHPVIGAAASCRGLYVAVMHSGMTLAPEGNSGSRHRCLGRSSRWRAAPLEPVGKMPPFRAAAAAATAAGCRHCRAHDNGGPARALVCFHAPLWGNPFLPGPPAGRSLDTDIVDLASVSGLCTVGLAVRCCLAMGEAAGLAPAAVDALLPGFGTALRRVLDQNFAALHNTLQQVQQTQQQMQQQMQQGQQQMQQ
ncbi:hypothetical protein TSOC_008369 [Tetrabaena socialis]|uniref:FAD dependent oxidoreductase domain-containing protein n=1 Tax=Tetrabaena socialis TaxID=47790 RepID=A0A2J7ZYN5_9CHLO|nr:hypothetical protein TSOC_008369 [Tetrabaena socialis]|eukprot:PNH05379.1 hypothetical protein TSOC_008369 [Tetrabaena socialis]